MSRTFKDCVDTARPNLFGDRLVHGYLHRPHEVDASFVAARVARCSSLQLRDDLGRLKKKRCDAHQATVPQRMGEVLGWAPRLTSLTVVHDEFLCGPSHPVPYPEALDQLVHLYLDGVQGRPLQRKWVELLGGPSMQRLTSLTLAHLHLGGETLHVGGQNFAWPQLTTLRLKQCDAGPGLFAALRASSLSRLTHLSLDVDSLYEVSESVTASAWELAQACASTLQNLTLQLPDDQNAEHALVGLQQISWPTLQRLTLPRVYFSPSDVRQLAETPLPALHDLCLENTVGNEANYRLLAASRHNRWHTLKLSTRPWITVERPTDVDWMLQPSFQALKGLKIVLAPMGASDVRAVLGALGSWVSHLEVDALDASDAALMAGLIGWIEEVPESLQELTLNPQQLAL